MGIGVSLILIAVGAILTWAVDATVSGLDVNAVGVILMVVGVTGMLLSLIFWSSWGGTGYARSRRTYVEPAAAGPSRRAYVEEPADEVYVERAPARRRRRVVEEDVASGPPASA
jgi:hypothetical protein